MKATAPNSYSYFQRNERDDVSPTLNIEYWPEGRSWGLQLNGKEFTNQYSDSSGNEFKGRNREYLLSSEFRLIKFSPSFRYDLRFGFGGKIRYFLINTNTTLENYRLYSLPIKMELDIHWEDYILVGAFTFAPIFKISQDATTSNPWDKGFGLDKKFELKIKKNVSEKVRVSLGAMIELTDVSLDTEVLDINERGFMIGIEFPFRF